MSLPEETPFADLLRDAITEQGVSVRALAKRLSQLDPHQRDADNWRRKLNKYLHEDTLPSPDAARLLSAALDKPANYFAFKRPRRTRAEMEALLEAARQENARLREELRRREDA